MKTDELMDIIDDYKAKHGGPPPKEDGGYRIQYSYNGVNAVGTLRGDYIFGFPGMVSVLDDDVKDVKFGDDIGKW